MRFAIAAIALSLVACAARTDADEKTASASHAIINGAISTPDQNFVVQLGMSTNGQYFGACSAIMVAKNLVLTARHCVGQFKDDTTWEMVDFAPEGLEVYYGADAPKRSDFDNKQPGDAKGVKLFVAATQNMMPDIALVLLDRPLENAQIARIRLDGGAKKGELLNIVGYGIDETSTAPLVRMQRKGVPVIDVGPITTTQHELFEGEFYFGEAACSGDSGGPALSATSGAVVGVASRVGNGLVPTDDNPAGFCVGAATEDVYTSLAPVKEVVLRAFQAAGAKPLLENDPDPVPEAPAQPPSSAPSASDDDDAAEDEPKPAKRTAKPATTATSGGCAMTSERSSFGDGCAFALLGVALACVRRRRPVTSARRCRSSFGCRRSATR
jgi:hypothetical protein